MESLFPAYTVSEFCRFARISEGFYFKLQRQGGGPVVARMGRRVVITQASAAKWMQEREGKPTKPVCGERVVVNG